MADPGYDLPYLNSDDNVFLHDDEGAEEKEKEEDMALCILLLKRRVHYLPVLTAGFIVVSFIISYSVSVSQGHVEPDFPYISHTAIKVPERCIFAQLINVGAFLLGANVFVRFLQQSEQFKPRGRTLRATGKDRRLCIASLVVGWLSALGLSMVANFQTIELTRAPHYVGAVLSFGLGLVYCWIQTSLSLRHHPKDCVTAFQLLNSIILSVCLVTFGVSKTIFKVKEGMKEGTKEGALRPVYLVSTISEWLTAAAVVSFLLTFYPSFSRITLQGPRVMLHEDRTYVTANGNTHHSNASSHGSISPV